MTFSIVARCGETGMFGVAISSSSPAVAARCAFTRAGVGAVASQNVTDPALGPLTLDLMADGAGAPDAVAEVRRLGRFMDYRQVLAVDDAGRGAIHSGAQVLGVWGQAQAVNAVAAGNLLASEAIPEVLLESFARTRGHLGDRLMAALIAGREAGGEAGPVHSAGLQLCDRLPWPVADLRIDWAETCPIDAVAAAWDVYKPQMDAYVQRALDPREAPSYGVPGDA